MIYTRHTFPVVDIDDLFAGLSGDSPSGFGHWDSLVLRATNLLGLIIQRCRTEAVAVNCIVLERRDCSAISSVQRMIYVEGVEGKRHASARQAPFGVVRSTHIPIGASFSKSLMMPH